MTAAYTPAQAKRLGVHLLNAEPRSALHGGVRVIKPSRFRRLLWVWGIPMVALGVLMIDWARWFAS